MKRIFTILLTCLTLALTTACNTKTKSSVNDHPVVVIKVKNYGDITVKLDRTQAPITVDNFMKLVNEKFYDPTIRGIDWAGYKTNYERFLPHINNNYDFQDLLSEMLGELNGSHTGARYYPSSSTLSVASLGLFYDDLFDGKGLKIKEIIPKSNLTKKKNKVSAGCIIEKIDGTLVDNNADYLLAGKVGKNILLSIYNPVGGIADG